MSKRIVKVFLIPGLLLTLLSFKSGEDQDRKNNVLIDVLYQGLVRNHFSEIKVDDAYSEDVFNTFLDRIDYGKRFLLKSDVEELSKYKDKIDDEILGRTHNFLDETVDTLEARIEEIRAYYKEILSEPFDFTMDEFLESDAEKRPYPESHEELKESWRKMLKYQTLTRVYDKMSAHEKALEKSDTIEVRTIAEVEESARKRVLKTFDDFFHRIDQLEYKDRFNMYLNSITNVFDPHTTFFPPKDKENFDISMTGQFEGIGATLSVRDGYITVVDIIPGSASYRQGDLKIDDKILKVAQGEEEAVDVVDMRLDEAVKLIRGKKGSEVRLTVQKVDESVVPISIIRDVVVIKETYAKSAVLQEGKDKVGYIYLPKFYADFNRTGAPNCADDIARELEKLQKENVEGVILDLRNNGGGSLQDAVKMAGLFIEEGPIVQVKNRSPKPYVFKDEDKDVQYEGPITILVNSYSASASEILAAAMQDYQRAVIVGSNSTYGKGTVQKVIDFDRVLPMSLADLKPLGALKITMQKFYRIDGTTTQLKGVEPDIVLPDVQRYIETGEKELDFALPFDEIASAEYDIWDRDFDKKIEKLKKSSHKRVESNEAFKVIERNAQLLRKRKDETRISLNYEKFEEYKEQIKAENEAYREVLDKPTNIDVLTLQSDESEISSDSTLTNNNEKWHKKLKNDLRLYETFQITKDLVDL